MTAVRRLAYEAADSGMLSPELAAGIRRVKGVKQLGFRAGNWLNRDQARLLLEKSDGESLRSTRDVAVDMKVSKMPAPVENFTIAYDKSGSGCALRLDWEATRASVDITAK